MNMDDEDALKMLLGMLEIWQQHLHMPKLSEYGVSEVDLHKVIQHISSGSMSTNPIVLEYQEIEALLKARL
jgi:alcohol dehydrogenase